MSVIKESFYVLIMAGGRGTRFWPRSRVHTPKQCLAVDGEASLLQRTIQRVKKCVPSERILVVTAADMEASVRSHCLDLPHENVLVEPEGRNTAPCVGWGLVEIGRRSRGEDADGGSPADHLILEEDRFVSQLLECAVRSCDQRSGDPWGEPYAARDRLWLPEDRRSWDVGVTRLFRWRSLLKSPITRQRFPTTRRRAPVECRHVCVQR